jgi:diguanylate cyclase (GGDEF)-like protein
MDPRAAVAYLTLAVASLAAAIGVWLPSAFNFAASHLGAAVALVAAFTVSERLIFHVEARNEAVSYAPTELALAVGLLFVHPGELLVARLVGATIGMLIWRRPPLFKLLFNLAHFALETVLAVAVLRAVGGDGQGAFRTWLGILAGLTTALVAGGILVATAISLFEGGLRDRVWREIVNVPVFHLPPAVLAASIAIPMTIEPWLGALAITPAPMVWLVIRSHGALLHRYTDLASVNDFSREVGGATDLKGIAAAAAERIAASCRAGRVVLRLWSNDGTPVDAFVGDPLDTGILPEEATDGEWADLLRAGPIHHHPGVAADPRCDALRGAGIEEALLGGVHDERGILGLIVLTNRQGASSSFDDDDRSRLGAMIQQLAVAARKTQFHSQLQYEATHDRLTSLPNRRYLEAWMDQSLTGSRTGSLLLIDLDRFKEINDAFGHHAGDALLVEAAARILSACGLADVAARLGGDEFAVFAPGVDAVGASALAGSISSALEAPFAIGPASVAVAASIGIATAPDHDHDTAGLLRRADLAMYDAKTRRVRASTYRDDLEENDATRLTLLADLRAALRDGDLEVHYQPQVDLATGAVCGAEALVRWSHPELGSIAPETFVGLAEQAGLIEELTRQVLTHATLAAAQWQRRGWPLTVSVNISAQSLLDEQLEPLVAEALRSSGLDPARLVLEITETTMMGDPTRTHRMLHRLAELGLGLSVDDFGTGHSSLVNLRHLPVSELKIDRSFVSEMINEHHDDVIVRSTIDLAHNLGLSVVAEGVENDAIRHRLASLGCDIGQGFGISRPIPHDAFLAWVAEHRRPSAFDRIDGAQPVATLPS